MSYFRKRGKKWYYTVETVDEYGNRKKVERPGGLTKPECERAWRAAMAEVDYTGDFSEPTNMTVQEYFDEWLSEYVEINLKKNTIRSYKSIVKNHINPVLGNVKLRKISARMLQNFLNTKKGKYSHGTLDSICAVLKKAFSYAAGMSQYIHTDPAAIIQVPRYIEAPKKTEVFSHPQLETLFSKFSAGHQFYLPMMLSYHTGMRLGECLALSWDDVNMEKHTIGVFYTLIDSHGTAEIQSIPKSKSSIRIIPFGQKLFKILKTEKVRQAALRLEYGKLYANKNIVCCWPDGSFMTSDNMRYFNQFCKSAFGTCSFHSLRHTHATMLLEGGDDLELVSKRLGHSSIMITSKTYSHVLEKRTAKTVKILDEIL